MIRKMAVWDILQLVSADGGGGNYYITGALVRDVWRSHKPSAELLKDMRENGQRHPVLVGPGSVVLPSCGKDPMGWEDVEVAGDGHHRVFAALALGWTEMDTTDDPEETGRIWGHEWSLDLELARAA